MLTRSSVVPLLIWIALTAGARNVAAAQTGGDASVFAPLTLGPAPSQTRLVNGSPGRKYWQNRADYDLKVVLDTATKMVSGSMTFRYTNNSPDTLRVLWFQTEQDSVERIERFVQLVQGRFVPVKVEPQQLTETKVTLATPIRPGGMATFQVAWQFPVPVHGSIFGPISPDRVRSRRMGRDGTLYEIAQWYPRVNVYDDVKGWNTEPYGISKEFYLEYGDYTLEVTVPADYIVAATGTLDNPAEVLTPTEIARLAVAAKADTVVHIVTEAELRNGAARPSRDRLLTWKFHATNVRDAVWAAAPDYQWDATSWHGILAQSYYRVRKASGFVDAADMARMSIQEFSERWFPYPYPQISAVEGPVGSMEYPMLSMVNVGTYPTITHEVGHNWFPMIVGSNERVHAWMDEGFNTFICMFSQARRNPEQDQTTGAGSYMINLAQQIAHGESHPVEAGGDAYDGPAALLQMLRRDIVGPTLFDAGFKAYIRRWAYKHPTPVDFFRTMNDVTGRNLDWYWREFFMESFRFNQAINSVSQMAQGGATKVTVTYGNKERGVMPLLVRFTFSDSSTQDFAYPAEVWKKNGAAYTVAYTFAGTVARIALDPDAHLVDDNRDDNVWLAK